MIDRKKWIPTIMVVVLLAVFGLVVAFALAIDNSQARSASSYATLVQDENESVVPEALARISWGAILAGTVMALMIQMTLNLLGVAAGATAINPRDENGLEEVKSVGMGTVAWMVISTLIALFIGGWLASRLAGQPDEVDGMLHGLIVWGVGTLASIILLTTAVGRFVSSVAGLLGDILHLTGQAVQTAAQGTMDIAQGVTRGTAQAAQSAAQQANIDSPEVSNAMNRFNAALDNIQMQAMNMLRQAGISPERVEGEVRQAAGDVRQAAQQAAQDPTQAEQHMREALSRIMNRGQSVADQADRQTVIDALVNNASMTPAQANQTLQSWEQTYGRARQEFEQVREQARRKTEQVAQQAQQQVQQVKQRAEDMSREAVDTTTNMVARLAGALFVALVIGAFAAGLGGYLGSPDELPVAEVQEEINVPGT